MATLQDTRFIYTSGLPQLARIPADGLRSTLADCKKRLYRMHRPKGFHDMSSTDAHAVCRYLRTVRCHQRRLPACYRLSYLTSRKSTQPHLNVDCGPVISDTMIRRDELPTMVISECEKSVIYIRDKQYDITTQANGAACE